MCAGVKAVSASVALLAASSAHEATSSATTHLRASAGKGASRAVKMAAGAAKAGIQTAVITAGAVTGTAEGASAPSYLSGRVLSCLAASSCTEPCILQSRSINISALLFESRPCELAP